MFITKIKLFFNDRKIKKELITQQKEDARIQAEEMLYRSNIDLASHHTECPVCLSELKYENRSYSDYYEGRVHLEELTCDNGCYTKKKEDCYSYTTFTVFDKQFRMFDGYIRREMPNIRKEINYWAENERYLTKILIK